MYIYIYIDALGGALLAAQRRLRRDGVGSHVGLPLYDRGDGADRGHRGVYVLSQLAPRPRRLQVCDIDTYMYMYIHIYIYVYIYIYTYTYTYMFYRSWRLALVACRSVI